MVHIHGRRTMYVRSVTQNSPDFHRPGCFASLHFKQWDTPFAVPPILAYLSFGNDKTEAMPFLKITILFSYEPLSKKAGGTCVFSLNRRVYCKKCLFPVVSVIDTDIGCFKYRVFAFFALFDVIVQCFKCSTAQNQADRNVNQCHKAHQYIG